MALTSGDPKIRRETIVVDAHNDTVVAHKRLDSRNDKTQIDLPKLKEGCVDLSLLRRRRNDCFESYLTYALDSFGFFDREVEPLRTDVALALTVEDLSRVPEQGKVATLLVIENSDALEGSLDVLGYSSISA